MRQQQIRILALCEGGLNFASCDFQCPTLIRSFFNRAVKSASPFPQLKVITFAVSARYWPKFEKLHPAGRLAGVYMMVVLSMQWKHEKHNVGLNYDDVFCVYQSTLLLSRLPPLLLPKMSEQLAWRVEPVKYWWMRWISFFMFIVFAFICCFPPLTTGSVF